MSDEAELEGEEPSKPRAFKLISVVGLGPSGCDPAGFRHRELSAPGGGNFKGYRVVRLPQGRPAGNSHVL